MSARRWRRLCLRVLHPRAPEGRGVPGDGARALQSGAITTVRTGSPWRDSGRLQAWI